MDDLKDEAVDTQNFNAKTVREVLEWFGPSKESLLVLSDGAVPSITNEDIRWLRGVGRNEKGENLDGVTPRLTPPPLTHTEGQIAIMYQQATIAISALIQVEL